MNIQFMPYGTRVRVVNAVSDINKGSCGYIYSSVDFNEQKLTELGAKRHLQIQLDDGPLVWAGPYVGVLAFGDLEVI